MAGQWHDKKQMDEWFDKLESSDNYNFIIELRPSSPADSELTNTESSDTPTAPTIVGSIGIHKTSEIGYMLLPSHWGKGYATETLSAFLLKAYEMLPEMGDLTAFTDAENEGSMGVLRKCGFKEIKREEYVNATLGKREEVEFKIGRGDVVMLER